MREQGEAERADPFESGAAITDLGHWQRKRHLHDLAELLADRVREIEGLRELVGVALDRSVGEDTGLPIGAPAGHHRVRTVLAIGLAGFLTWSESAPADLILPTLNSHLSLLAGVIVAEGGDIVDVGEDGLTATFDQPVTAARTVLLVRRALVDTERRAREQARPVFPAAMALTTGPSLVGWITPGGRIAQVLIGPAATLARQLQGLTQPGGLCLDRATFQACGSLPVARRKVLHLPGQAGLHAIYEVAPEHLPDLERLLGIEIAEAPIEVAVHRPGPVGLSDLVADEARVPPTDLVANAGDVGAPV